MFVLKASDRNPMEQEADGGKEGKQRSMCSLYVYFVMHFTIYP
jgi:hypothetical protein